jgi:xanthine dehydrogenase accessory factor
MPVMQRATSSPELALAAALAQAPAIRVRVARVQGSAPRDAGTWMAVLADHVIGTIGGGHLEFDAITRARAMLARTEPLPAEAQRYALGPSLGQCCGGVMWLEFELLTAQDIPALATRLQAGLQPVALFGGGHVGQAIARQLTQLPFALHWIDSRDEIFPPDTPPPHPLRALGPGAGFGSRSSPRAQPCSS